MDTTKPSLGISDNYATRQSYDPVFREVCPTDNRFQIGTVFAAVSSALTDTTYKLYVERYDIKPRNSTPPATCTPQDTLNGTHICLNDGDIYQGRCVTTPQTDYYSFRITGCQTIKLAATSLTGGTDVDLYAGASPSITTEPYFGTSDWGSFTPADDFVLTAVCPPAGETSVVIYIGVDCFTFDSNGGYLLSVQTVQNTSLIYQPVGSLVEYNAPLDLLSAIRIGNGPGTDGLFLCDSWGFSCNVIYPSYPSLAHVNPFWPMPFYVGALINSLNFVLEDRPPLVPASNALVFFVVLDYTDPNGGNFVNFDITAFSQLTFTHLGKLTNKIGEPVIGTFSNPKFKPLTCDNTAFTELSNTVIQPKVEKLKGTGTNVAAFEVNNLRFQLDTVRFNDEWAACQTLLNSMLTSKGQVSLQMSTACVSIFATSAYYNDPCCWQATRWITPCVPRPVNITVVQAALNNDIVQGSCENSQCVQNFLQEYQAVATQQANNNDPCNVDQRAFTNYLAGRYDTYRACKTNFADIPCFSDI